MTEIGYDAGDRGEPEYPEQHECEWYYNNENGMYSCKARHCKAAMGKVFVASRLNEYETLKKGNEALSAEIVIRNIIIYGEGGFVTDQFLAALKAYADILEGKDG